MTPEQIERHRKRFEELFSKTEGSEKLAVDSLGRYESSMSHFMWMGYLLCEQDREYELPMQTKNTESDLDIGFNYAIWQCKRILESQGIKVKP